MTVKSVSEAYIVYTVVPIMCLYVCHHYDTNIIQCATRVLHDRAFTSGGNSFTNHLCSLYEYTYIHVHVHHSIYIVLCRINLFYDVAHCISLECSDYEEDVLEIITRLQTLASNLTSSHEVPKQYCI